MIALIYTFNTDGHDVINMKTRSLLFIVYQSINEIAKGLAYVSAVAHGFYWA